MIKVNLFFIYILSLFILGYKKKKKERKYIYHIEKKR